MKLPSSVVYHRPVRPLPCSPSSPPPPEKSHFHSAPLYHWAVVMWLPFRASKGTRISQWGPRGWGRFPSYRLTTVALACLCKKCTLRTVLVTNLPLHPFTGQSRSPAALGKDIRYVYGMSSSGGGVSHYPLPLLRPCQHHVTSSSRSPATLPPGLHPSKDIETLSSVGHGRRVPTLSSSACKLLPTGSPP